MKISIKQKIDALKRKRKLNVTEIYGIFTFLLVIVLLYAYFTGGLPKKGVETLLQNYILISTAILAITFAAISINEKILVKEVRLLVEAAISFSLLGVLFSIISLYFTYVKGDSNQFAGMNLFLFATFFVISSIMAMALLSIEITNRIAKVPRKKSLHRFIQRRNG
jgi:hypothetical protein